MAVVPERWRAVLPDEEAQALKAYQRPRDTQPDLSRAALLVIDVVESFCGPDRPVLEAQVASRQACGEAAWRAVPQIQRLLAAFRDRAATVVYTVVASGQNATGAATAGRVSRDGLLREDVVIDEVAPRPSELVLPKSKSSAFFGTPLVPALVRADVRTVVLVGTTTSGCVIATAIDAASNGFDVIVVGDACFDRVPTLHEAALVTMDAKWARVEQHDELLDRLGQTLVVDGGSSMH